MTIIELKKKLKAYPLLKHKLDDIFSEIASINARADILRNVKSPVIDGMPRGTGLSNPTYQAVQLLVDEYDGQIDTLLCEARATEAEIQLIKELLKRLSVEEKQIIDIHYFEQVRWDFVPAKVFISRRTCFRLHDSAFRKMAE